MATLREQLENHPAVFFLGAILAGFLAGIGGYESVLRISNQTTISNDELADLRRRAESNESNKVGPQMSPISYDMDRPGEDFPGTHLARRFPAQCRDACAAKPGCQAWAHQPPDKCWLKHGKPSEKARTGFASGVKLN